MTCLVVVLYVLSVALPVTGLVNVYRRELGRPVERLTPGDGTDINDFNVLLPLVKRSVREAAHDARRDLWLIGGGVGAGGLAGILSLLL